MNETADRPLFIRKGRLLPPPRPGVRYVSVYLTPFIVISDDELRRRIDRRFHWPMIMFALLMIPLLVVELWMPNAPLWLKWIGWIGMSLIWFAFVVEFVIKIAIAESRLEYAKRNWLDILIIVLPALRPLRAGAVVRTSKLFTLRGAGIKFARLFFTAMLGLEATDRLLERIGIKKAKTRRHPDEMTRYEITKEILRLRRLAEAWEEWHEREAEYLEELGVNLYEEKPPPEDRTDEIEPTDPASDFADEPTIAPSCESPSPN